MTKMIKLTHIISDTNIGGAGKYLLAYLNNCDRNTFDISVIVPTNSRLIKEIEALGFKVISVDGMADKSFSTKAVNELIKVFKAEKPDIVHTHATLSGRIAARFAGVKTIVYTRHSVFEPKKYLTKGIGKCINGRVGGYLSDRIIAVAGAAKKNLTDTGIKDENIDVIYNGVDGLSEISDEQKAIAKKAFGISDDEFIIAIIARLELVKGHEYFIDAAGLVKKAGIKAKFVIAGTGTREEALRAYAREKGLDDVVLFTGFLNNVSSLMNIMDIQANASFGTEAASLSLLEGMSIGKPAVVSDFGGNPELIKDDLNGYVVPKQNAAALANAIIKLLSDENSRNKISKQSREVFENRFTSRIMTNNMESFYKNICEVKR